MTPRERAEELCKAIIGTADKYDDAETLTLIESAIVATVAETQESAISDIHGQTFGPLGLSADAEIQRLTALMKGQYIAHVETREKLATVERERDEALAETERYRKQYQLDLVDVREMRTDLAQRDRRIAAMSKALEELRPHKDHEDECAQNYDEGPCDCTFGTKHRIIDAALSSSPAQPATAETEEAPQDPAPRDHFNYRFTYRGEQCSPIVCSACGRDKPLRYVGDAPICKPCFDDAPPSPAARVVVDPDHHVFVADPPPSPVLPAAAAREDDDADCLVCHGTGNVFFDGRDLECPCVRHKRGAVISSNRDDTERSRILELEKALRQVRRYCRKVIDERYIHIIDAVLSPALEPPNRVDEVCNFRWDTTDGHHYCGEDPATKHRHVCACCNEFAT